MSKIKIGIWNVQGSGTIKSAAMVNLSLDKNNLDAALLTETNIKLNKVKAINTQYKNKETHHSLATKGGQRVSQIIINKSITTNTKTINERLITSNWTIANTSFKCTTLYAPAKESIRLKWFKKNLTEDVLDSDIITGDFNVNNKAKANKINIYINYTLKEAGFKELKTDKGVTFPRNNANIDRIFVSKKIAHLNPSTTIKNIKEKSDHNMLVLDLTVPNYTPVKKKKSLWRQNLETTKNHLAAEKINQQIEYFSDKFKDKQGPYSNLNVCQRWLKMKKEIKKQAVSNEINIANKQRCKINKTHQKIQQSNIPSRTIFLKEKLNKLLKEESINKLTNQTNTHINNKETPSKFLTRKLKIMKKNNEIQQILDPKGTLVNSNEEILETARAYYEKLYEKKDCNEEAHQSLLETFTKEINPNILKSINTPIEEEEIRLCVEKLQEGKAPGEDGLIPTFYKNHLNQILPMLLELYNHFWDNDIPKEIKQGLIIIIYKNKGDPNNLDNYRPITLLNVDYKIYSKIINNRILRFLDKIISPYQSGFVPNRLLHDNIITLNTTIELINREMQIDKSLNPIITFYDFEKAFDSISHNSILRTLAHLKLPFKFIMTIMNMLKESETAVYINNEVSERFISKRGTKQGDPISPTLFAIIVECMATAIIADRNIKGIGPEMTKILLFADDTTTTALRPIDHEIMDHLIKRFCTATSAKINKSKCTCITFNNNTNTLYSKSTSSERYLGFNFNNKGVESKINSIANKIKTQLNSWNKITSTKQRYQIHLQHQDQKHNIE
ncbi:hypothetical protein ACTFIW_005667 [Dictyostelium discoideum]